MLKDVIGGARTNHYALFTQEQEKSSYEIRNCLISFVDQPGLEPGTSRL